MKIIYKTSNLVEAPEPVIVHGCNAQGKMNSGVAKAIRQAFPWAYAAYEYAWTQDRLVLGSIIWANSPEGEPIKTIGNGITQARYGYGGIQYVSYDAVRKIMQEVADLANIFGRTEVAMPMIGAGLGGGDWDILSRIIEEQSGNAFQPIVYKLI
jgi:O-acetyl-ADP-ribose deacetylase (regulator of RNase III)